MANNDIVSGFDDEKDESLSITLERTGKNENCLILHLTGYIDTYNSSSFQRKVQKAIETGFIRLIFQCEKLNYVSSTGIGSFTLFLKTVKPRGGDIVLMGFQPKVNEVFQLLGFSQFFTVRDSLEEAVHFFGGGTDEDSASVFPSVFACPNCSKKLKASKPGRFRCSKCEALFSIEANGKIILG